MLTPHLSGSGLGNFDCKLIVIRFDSECVLSRWESWNGHGSGFLPFIGPKGKYLMFSLKSNDNIGVRIESSRIGTESESVTVRHCITICIVLYIDNVEQNTSGKSPNLKK